MKSSLILLVAAVLQAVVAPSYDADLRAWSFSGQVTEIRDVSLLGEPAQVVKVGDIWAVARIGAVSLASAPLATGDRVVVSISGAHVSQAGVDWSQCDRDEKYCRLGALLDSGLDSPDLAYPLTPSNDLIHHGRAARHWMDGALFWNLDQEPALSKDTSPPADMPGLPEGAQVVGTLNGRRTLVVVNNCTHVWLYLRDGQGWQVSDYSHGTTRVVLDTNEACFARAAWRVARGLHDADFHGLRFSPNSAFE